MTADATANIDTRMDYGQNTVSMVNEHFAKGAERGVAIGAPFGSGNLIATLMTC